MFEQEMLRNLKNCEFNETNCTAKDVASQLFEFLLYNDFSDDQNTLCFISWLSTNQVID